MQKYILSCCSTIDLPRDYVEKRDIKFIGLSYTLDGKEYTDDLGKTMPMSDFYKAMANGAMTKTSQVNVDTYIEYFGKFLEDGYDIVPEIMIPLVGEKKELKFVKDIVVETAEKVKAEKGSDIEYHIGTMIEIPRAALTADEIAEEAEFFSFGTNDLTQMTFGFSRDDAGKFLDSYYKAKIYESDPFAKLDQDGVGKLVKMAAEKGRATRPNIKLGICGEHGGEPSSVEFCHKVGLNYVSCSPFRVPIARLAAAQAALKNK